ncbi:hypothetical protein QR680_011222 [Steinernema hermaphroditum]|uniref:RecQ-mediated genome instability protein 1 n=1 Tax=Steinernema hermaphroditum TaxID=289476 RepID=A0AA39ISQ7_9BILA|nr:hypothetical protein QR680_011222 [Steinernema hermaphroditum]
MGDATVQRFFSSYHIELKDDWRQSAVSFILAEKAKRNQKVKTVDMVGYLFEQWLFSDIGQSTLPKLRIPANASRLSIVTKVPLQILSVMDISKPFYGQYRSIINRASNANNNAEFRSEIDQDEEDEKKKESTRETLMLVLTDGQTTVKGLRYTAIPHLTKKTLPGTKVMLIGKTVYRHGCLMLTAENLQIIGGHCQKLVEKHALVYELANRLKIDTRHVKVAVATSNDPQICDIPPSEMPPVEPTENRANLQVPAANDTLRAVDGTFDRTTSNRLFECPPEPSHNISNSFYNDSLLEEVQILPKAQEQPFLKNVRKLTSDKSLAPMKQRKRTLRQSTIDEWRERSFMETSTSTFARGSDTDTSAITTVVPKSEQKVVWKSIENHQHGAVERRKRKYSPEEPSHPKPVPCFGFNDTTLGATQGPSLLHDIKVEADDDRALVPFTPRPLTLVDHFRELKIASLAEVLKQKRFWLKPETRLILPILSESSRDIGTAMDQWSLMIYVSDEHRERVEMVLQNDLLVELLGFTVQYCKELSSAGKQAELAQCRDRALQVLSIFKRLDLVYTVEFSPFPKTVPVIRKVENLARTLALC